MKKLLKNYSSPILHPPLALRPGTTVPPAPTLRHWPEGGPTNPEMNQLLQCRKPRCRIGLLLHCLLTFPSAVSFGFMRSAAITKADARLVLLPYRDTHNFFPRFLYGDFPGFFRNYFL